MTNGNGNGTTGKSELTNKNEEANLPTAICFFCSIVQGSVTHVLSAAQNEETQKQICVWQRDDEKIESLHFGYHSACVFILYHLRGSAHVTVSQAKRKEKSK